MDKVNFYMGRPVVKIDSDRTVLDTVKLMREIEVGAILIRENDEIVGIFTESDLLRKVVAEGKSADSIKVSEVMSKPLVSVDAEDKMFKAFTEMHQHHFRHLGVTEDKKVVGVLSIKDIAKYYVNKVTKQKGGVAKEDPSKKEVDSE